MTTIPYEKYQAFLFDLDGTVAHSMPLHNEAWNQTLKEYGHQISFDVLQSHAGISTFETVKLLNQNFGWKLDPATITKKKEENFLKSLDQVTVVPAIFEVMQTYSQVPMAIVSGGPRENVEKMLKLLKVENYFQFLVCAEDTKKGKPHPDPFLLAAKLLNISPEKCLVFEDGEMGIIGAQKAGMAVVRVDMEQNLSFIP